MDTILLVEDDQNLLFLTRQLLLGEGYKVLSASDGLEAQERLEAEGDRIDAVVLDWMMPRMSGIELLQWMKHQERVQHIPVVMVTAMADAQSVRQGIDAGAFYYLTKPVGHELLVSIVNAAVGDYRLRKDLLARLQLSENPLQHLQEGVFRVQRLADGEQLAVWIANASGSAEAVVGISEMITNAIEHGNLGITYQEKTELMAAGQWYEEVERRRLLPENRDKYVTVRLKREATSLIVLIEDEGDGFDFRRYLQLDEVRVFDNHGRGIAIAHSSLALEYLGNGNAVRLTLPA